MPGKRAWLTLMAGLLGCCSFAVHASHCTGPFPSVSCLTVRPGPAPRVATVDGQEPPTLTAARPVDQMQTSEDPTRATEKSLPRSKDELFGQGKSGDITIKEKPAVALRGFLQQETAYTYASPAHWSRAVTYAQVGALGQITDNLKWKATVRGDVDPIYIWSNFYNDAVKQDQRASFLIEETYIDTSIANWDLRIGRQHIVWGEVIGLFIADVVSAQNQLEFILPPFDIIRVPQWAARAEYFLGDTHLELIWIPYPTYNRVGKPGADFFPVQTTPPPGFTQTFLPEIQPDHTLANSNYGMRLSTLKNGWDVSGFYYHSEDAAPTFTRNVMITPTPTLIYQPQHNRIWQIGGTAGKAFGSVVFHTEAVYTSGRQYEVTVLSQPNGVVPQNTLAYIFSLDFTLPRDTLLNVQLLQNVFFNHNPDLLFDQYETAASVMLRGKLGSKFEPEILWIQSLNRWENVIRPRLTWRPATNWRAAFGVDIFNGPITGYFGRFRDRDRVYLELHYDF